METRKRIWDMGQQARQVEILTFFVFAVLLAVSLWLISFKIELTAPAEQGRQVIARVNIFELLLSKK
jgi:hypothetical protein